MIVPKEKRKNAPLRDSLSTASVAAPSEEVRDLGGRKQRQDWAPCYLPRAARRGKRSRAQTNSTRKTLSTTPCMQWSHVGASIQREYYVAYVKDRRGGWFQMDDHKISPVSLSEVLKVQAYMLFYIQKVPRDAGIGSVNQQNEQVSDSMDEDGTPVADETPSLPDSKTRTEPEQVAIHSAPTVAEPAEEPSKSHTIALAPPAVCGRKRPVLVDPPTGIKKSDSNLNLSGVWINYFPSVCEHRQSPTTATAHHGSTAQGAPLREGRTDSVPMDPSRMPPASRVETTTPEVPTAPVFRQQPQQTQTSPVKRPQPSRADSGATRQADMADLQDHVSQEMTKLYPLIVDLHRKTVGHYPGLSNFCRG